MANAMVDKVKRFGIRHGEKVAVGLVAALCVACFVMAGTHEKLDITPKQIDDAANTARSNLSKKPTAEAVVAQINQENLVVPAFAEEVRKIEAQGGRPALAFNGPSLVFPEPGAGLLRETPTLIAPTQLFASTGRGSVLVFERDAEGNIVFEEAKKEEPKKQASSKSRRKNRYSGGSGSMMAGYMQQGMGAMSAGAGGPQGNETEEEKKKREEREKRLREQLFVGTASATEKKVAEELETKAAEGRDPKEVAKGYRWVALVGELDHETQKNNVIDALKDPNANPNYLRVDIQRRQLVDDQWTDWVDIDRTVNDDVLAHACEKDEEFTPDDVRLDPLVDFLPFLKVGAYRGVHLKGLVPEEKLTVQTTATAPAGGMMGGSKMVGRGGSGSGAGASMASMMSGMSSSGGASGGAMSGMSGMDDMMSSYMSGSGGYGGSGGMMGGAAAKPTRPVEADFPKSNAPKLMVRALDYTVDPDAIYDYRVRLVLRNPNLGWDDSVKPGTDTTAEELFGPWSDATGPVVVPADVTSYAMQMSPGDVPGEAVDFQVVKWNEADGLTIVKNFSEIPGHFVGEMASAAVPKDDGKGRASRAIDFNSRQLLLDVAGGPRSLSGTGLGSGIVAAPAVAVVMRYDGVLVVRDQAEDATNTEMRQLKEIYNQILKDADEGGRKRPAGGGMMGMGGMSGMSGMGEL